MPVDNAARVSTGMDLDQAEVRLALAPPGEGDAVPVTWDWSYLPTEERSGFGVHVHADFYLSNSRKNVSLPRMQSWEEVPLDGGDPPAWNALLMVEAARLLVQNLWDNRSVLWRRDFWLLCTPEACSAGLFRWEVTRRSSPTEAHGLGRSCSAPSTNRPTGLAAPPLCRVLPSVGAMGR